MREMGRRSFLAGGAAVLATAGLAVAGGTALGSTPARPRAAGGDWWRVPPIRSQRPWAAGTTFWNYDSLPQYDEKVALADGGGGGSHDGGRTSTWVATTGGDPDDPGTIATKSQLDWSNTSTNFGAVFNYLPPDSAWVCWVLRTVPEDPAERGPLTGSDTVWDEVNKGTYDKHYRAMGQRIAQNFAARGIPLERFLGRPNHEMNQSNPYQVFPQTAKAFQTAMDRTIDQIREGANHPLHFAFAPAVHDNIAPYQDWCPTECDVLSMSYHPSNKVTDKASWNTMINQGDSHGYPIMDLVRASDALSKPIAFLEWSPRNEANLGCPIADLVYGWTHDFFTQYQDRLVVDLVHSPDTLNPNAFYDGQPGKAAWARAVKVFEQLWHGKTSA